MVMELPQNSDDNQRPDSQNHLPGMEPAQPPIPDLKDAPRMGESTETGPTEEHIETLLETGQITYAHAEKMRLGKTTVAAAEPEAVAMKTQPAEGLNPGQAWLLSTAAKEAAEGESKGSAPDSEVERFRHEIGASGANATNESIDSMRSYLESRVLKHVGKQSDEEVTDDDKRLFLNANPHLSNLARQLGLTKKPEIDPAGTTRSSDPRAWRP